MIDYKAAQAAARDERPFANGTEGYGWMGAWCDRCAHDIEARTGELGAGCPLILIAMCGKTPIEFLDQKRVGPDGTYELYSIEDQYHCVMFRDENDEDPEPHPIPDPPGQGQLVPHEQFEGVRMLVAMPQRQAVR